MKSLLILAVMLASPMMMTGSASAQVQPNLDTYYTWCDNVELILNNATKLANGLYGQTKFAQAKQVMVNAFRQALNSAALPGSFRPNTYRELQRSIELIQTLEFAAVPNQTLKDKMIAYVALNRVSVVNYVKRSLDRPYTIPCYGRRCGYGNPSVNMNQYEFALASVARLQLQWAQDYSTRVIPGRRIEVYPLVDAQTYFTIISKAARWAAEDLSMTLFGSTFSCAIIELQNLDSEAASMASMAGDVYTVQYIYHKVDALKNAMNASPYGCGGVNYPDYPSNAYDHDDGINY